MWHFYCFFALKSCFQSCNIIDTTFQDAINLLLFLAMSFIDLVLTPLISLHNCSNYIQLHHKAPHIWHFYFFFVLQSCVQSCNIIDITAGAGINLLLFSTMRLHLGSGEGERIEESRSSLFLSIDYWTLHSVYR